MSHRYFVGFFKNKMSRYDAVAPRKTSEVDQTSIFPSTHRTCDETSFFSIKLPSNSDGLAGAEKAQPAKGPSIFCAKSRNVYKRTVSGRNKFQCLWRCDAGNKSGEREQTLNILPHKRCNLCDFLLRINPHCTSHQFSFMRRRVEGTAARIYERAGGGSKTTF